MARRHVRIEVEDKGWGHDKAHRLSESSIKPFKGMNQEADTIQLPERVAETVVVAIQPEAQVSPPPVQEVQEVVIPTAPEPMAEPPAQEQPSVEVAQESAPDVASQAEVPEKTKKVKKQKAEKEQKEE